MNRIKTLCIFVCGVLFATNTIALEKDKQLHLAASTTIGAGVSVLSGDAHVGMISCSIIGGAKEIIDPYTGGTRDIEDMYYNLAGCALGSYILGEGWNLMVDDESWHIEYTLKF